MTTTSRICFRIAFGIAVWAMVLPAGCKERKIIPCHGARVQVYTSDTTFKVWNHPCDTIDFIKDTSVHVMRPKVVVVDDGLSDNTKNK